MSRIFIEDSYKGHLAMAKVDQFALPLVVEQARTILKERLIFEVDRKPILDKNLRDLKAAKSVYDKALKKATNHMRYVLSPSQLQLVDTLHLESIVLSDCELNSAVLRVFGNPGAIATLVYDLRMKLDKEILNALFEAEKSLSIRSKNLKTKET